MSAFSTYVAQSGEVDRWFGRLRPGERTTVLCTLFQHLNPLDLRFVSSIVQKRAQAARSMVRTLEHCANSPEHLQRLFATPSEPTTLMETLHEYVPLLAPGNTVAADLLAKLICKVHDMDSSHGAFGDHLCTLLVRALQHPAFAAGDKESFLRHLRSNLTGTADDSVVNDFVALLNLDEEKGDGKGKRDSSSGPARKSSSIAPLSPQCVRSLSCESLDWQSGELPIGQLLKALRLHKYTPNFEGTSLRQLITFGETDLVQRGLTTGAARKLRKYLDEMDFSVSCSASGEELMPPADESLSGRDVEAEDTEGVEEEEHEPFCFNCGVHGHRGFDCPAPVVMNRLEL